MSRQPKHSNTIGFTLGPVYLQGTDATPQPQPVSELTPEQDRLKKRIETAKTALAKVDQERANLTADFKRAVSECQHPVFNDTDAYPWYLRTCFICGCHIDTI